MTQRVDLTPEHGVVVTLPAIGRRPLPQAAIVPIAKAVAGVMFDLGGDTTSDSLRLAASIDGAPTTRPAISTRLELRGGGRRRLLLLGRPADTLIDRHIDLTLGGKPVASVDPAWLQSPLRTWDDLLEGLSDHGRRQLLKLFLSTGASLFGADSGADFTRAARRLLDLLDVRAVAATSWSPLGTSARLLSYRMAAPVDAARIGPLVAMGAERVTRLPGCKLTVEAGGGAFVLHVVSPHPVPTGAALIGLGDTPVHLSAPAPELPARPLHTWLERCDETFRAWIHTSVAAEAERDPVAAALLRELHHDDAAGPSLSVRHLSGTSTGLLYALDLEDPERLLRAIRIERGADTVDVEVDTAAAPRGAVTTLTGFAALSRTVPRADVCRIRLAYRSGRLRTVHEGPLGGFAGSVPAEFPMRPTRDAIESLARARLAMDRADATSAVEDFGPDLSAPAFSIVAGVGANLDLIRARAALLFAEPGASGVEMILHAPAGPLSMAARTAIADTTAVFGLTHRLVTVGADADPSTRLIAALRSARGPRVLALGADAAPLGRGWLAHWTREIGPASPVVGGTLLSVDGSIVDAGQSDPRRANRRAPGLPGAGLPQSASATTTRVGAACVGLSRAGVDLLLAAVWHPEPDVLLAQVVARAELGGIRTRTLLRGRFAHYGDPSVRNPLTLAADAHALALVLKRSFSLVGEEDAS